MMKSFREKSENHFLNRVKMAVANSDSTNTSFFNLYANGGQHARYNQHQPIAASNDKMQHHTSKINGLRENSLPNYRNEFSGGKILN